MAKDSRRRKGRRARGTGSIFFDDRRGKWVGRKPVGRTAGGKTKYVERWGDTQGEVVRKLAAATAPGPATTVGEWAARWLDTLTVRPSTRAGYAKTVAEVVVPELGHLTLAAVTAGHVEAVSAELLKSLGPNTVRLALAHAHILFQAAVRSRLIAANPVALARKPKGRRAKIDPFTPAELAAVVRAADGYSTGGAIAACATTGCRVGEALGLNVEDFDGAAGTMTVCRTTSFEHGDREPKTANGFRTVRIPALAIPAFRQAAERGRKGQPLFRSRADTRLNHQAVAVAWRAVLKKCGLAYRKPHQLRHSVATAMVAAGVPIGDIAKYLGDTPATIARTYLHPSGADPAAAMDRLLGGEGQGR